MSVFRYVKYVLATAHVFLFIHTPCAQIVSGSFDPEVDTSYVDLQYDKWSLRILSTYKNQNFLLTNTKGKTVKYIPNDRISSGLGFSYKYLIIDIGVRLFLSQEDFTSRFDLQGEVALQKHLFDVFIQRYKGFNKMASEDDPAFRGDVRSWVVGMNYLYNFNHKKLSLRSVITGNRQQKRTAGTFLLGGFFSVQDLEGDSTLVTAADGNFNEFAEMESAVFNNAGVMGGYAFMTPITSHIFLFGGIVPGVGANFGEVDGTRSYQLAPRPMAKLNTRAAMGYIGSRWYGGVHYISNYFIINLPQNNLFKYNIAKLRVIIGYKFDAKNTVVERILGK